MPIAIMWYESKKQICECIYEYNVWAVEYGSYLMWQLLFVTFSSYSAAWVGDPLSGRF